MADPLPAQQAGPSPQGATGDPVVAFLFLTRGDVNLPEIWQRFMAAGGNPPVLSHAKDLAAAERGFLRGTSVATRIPTAWGTITGPRAMLILLQEAMRNPATTHFAFLSESCIPVKTYAQITNYLRADPRSMIDLAYPGQMGSFHMDRWKGAVEIEAADWRMHSNWCVLDRPTAGCILSEDLTWKFRNVFAPDEHYFGTVLALHRYPRERINHLKSTWDNWTLGTPAYFHRVDQPIVDELSNFPGFFARKFKPESDIATSRLFL